MHILLECYHNLTEVSLSYMWNKYRSNGTLKTSWGFAILKIIYCQEYYTSLFHIIFIFFGLLKVRKRQIF